MSCTIIIIKQQRCCCLLSIYIPHTTTRSEHPPPGHQRQQAAQQAAPSFSAFSYILCINRRSSLVPGTYYTIDSKYVMSLIICEKRGWTFFSRVFFATTLLLTCVPNSHHVLYFFHGVSSSEQAVHPVCVDSWVAPTKSPVVDKNVSKFTFSLIYIYSLTLLALLKSTLYLV